MEYTLSGMSETADLLHAYLHLPHTPGYLKSRPSTIAFFLVFYCILLVTLESNNKNQKLLERLVFCLQHLIPYLHRNMFFKGDMLHLRFFAVQCIPSVYILCWWPRSG